MKKYVFKSYELIFPELFTSEKERITSHVKNRLHIEHIGSTAVPNLGGKGIIDIAIAVEKNEMISVALQLQELGYELRPLWSTLDRLFFRADLPDPIEEIRRYHVHLTHSESKDWIDFISFRDYLRNHPEEAINYAELKKKAAEEVNEDGSQYRELKDHIFKKMLAKYKKEKTQEK